MWQRAISILTRHMIVCDQKLCYNQRMNKNKRKHKHKHTRTKADDILDMIADRMHTPPAAITTAQPRGTLAQDSKKLRAWLKGLRTLH